MTAPSRPTRLAIVDGHRGGAALPVLRLAAEIGIRPVPAHALWRLRLRRPDVVVYGIDFDDPVPDLAALSALAARYPVLVVSASRLRDDLAVVRACGARGHLSADRSAADVHAAAREIRSGREVWPTLADEPAGVVPPAARPRSSYACALPLALTLPAFTSTTMGAAAIVMAVALCLWLRHDQRRAARRRVGLVRGVVDHARRRERVRYSRLLHDHVLQTMEFLATSSDIGDPRLRRHLADEAQWLRRLVEEPDRDRTAGVAAPPVVPSSVLLTGLADTVMRFRDRSLDVDLDLFGAALPPSVASCVVDAIVGSVDAALGNVVRHAGVGTASVKVACDNGGMAVTIADRGRGFAVGHTAPGFGQRQSIGGRMAAVGGWTEVSTAPDAGTVVRLSVPVRA